MNHGCNLIVSPFNSFQARFKDFGDVGLSSTLKVYKVFTKAGWGPWLNRKLCLGPASVINCTPLSTLSFWASLFPRAFGYSNAIQPSHSLSSPSAPALNWVLLRLGSSAEFMVNISIQNIIPFLVQNLFSSRVRSIKEMREELKPCVHVFWGKTQTDAETEVPILWPLDVKNWLIGKDPDAGKDWRQEEKGMTEDEMVGWHHWFNVYEFEQALGDGEGQGRLACCSPWGRKELDITDCLNNNNNQNDWSSWAQVETMFSYGSVWWLKVKPDAVKNTVA